MRLSRHVNNCSRGAGWGRSVAVLAGSRPVRPAGFPYLRSAETAALRSRAARATVSAFGSSGRSVPTTVFGGRACIPQGRCYSTDGTDAAQGKPSEGEMTAEKQSKLDKANKLIEDASAKFEEEEFSKSLPMFKEALQLRREAFGDDHPDVGEAYHFVAEVLWGLGHYKEAEATLRTSLPIMSKHLGPKHKSVGSILKNICECRQAFLAENEDKVPKEKATKLLKDVLPLAREATEIAKAHAINENDEDYLDALYTLGEIYIQLDRYAEALPAFELNLPRIEEKQGAQSVEALICLRNLASCYQALGEEEKWADIENKMAKITTSWQEDDSTKIQDEDDLRQTMATMGLDKNLQIFDDMRKEIAQNHEAKKNKKPSASKNSKKST